MRLIVITGPIGAGKNTVADLLADRLVRGGWTIAIVDVDDVAAMIAGPGAAASGLWRAAHRVHGNVVAAWLRAAADVIAVGPVYDEAEQASLLDPLPDGVDVTWVAIEAPVEVTLDRVQADPSRRRSKEEGFHRERHARYRALRDSIPAGPRHDSSVLSAEQIADAIAAALHPTTASDR